MSPSMEKDGIEYEVFKHIYSRAESDRDTLAKDQIHLAAFLCIPVSERLERCLGKHPEKLWVKIPNYFCLSTYHGARSAPRLPHALSALWLLARLLPEGQAAVRALRVSPGLQNTPNILRWMARIYSAACIKMYGCKVFSQTRLDPRRL